MMPEVIIDKAIAAGVHLAANAGELDLMATKRPPAELLELLRNHKAEVLAELERLQRQWLERVAHALQRPPDWLLEHGIIDANDMCELWHTEPRQVARIAMTGLQWHKVRYIQLTSS